MACVTGVPYVMGACSLQGGDFRVMIEKEEYATTLFVFNDNVSDSFEHPRVGAGSAVIRPYVSHLKGRRAVGIPTGWMAASPFVSLDDQTTMIIDIAFERVVTVFLAMRYEHIVFPCDPSNRAHLGTATFSVAQPVMHYINKRLSTLSNRLLTGVCTPIALLNRSQDWIRNRLDAERSTRRVNFRVERSFAPFDREHHARNARRDWSIRNYLTPGPIKRARAGPQLDDSAEQLDDSAEQLDVSSIEASAGPQLDESTEQLDESTEQLDESTEQVDESTEQLDESTEQLDESTEQLDDSTEQLDDSAKQLDDSAKDVPDRAHDNRD